MQRIAVFALTLALTAVAAVPQGKAESYPSRPIRLIIGFPPGSAADITARLVGDAMSRTLGQQVVVEARPGAGSSIAAEFVARSPVDGYTLFIGTLSNVTNAVTSSNLRFDFGKDFAPVTPLTGLPLILAVHPSVARPRLRAAQIEVDDIGEESVSSPLSLERAHKHEVEIIENRVSVDIDIRASAGCRKRGLAAQRWEPAIEGRAPLPVIDRLRGCSKRHH